MVFSLVVFVFPFLPLGCVFCCMFLDQVSPHWLTFSFPSTSDSCMYLPVHYDSEAFYHSGIFSHALTVPRCFVEPHPPTCLQSLFSTLVVEWYTWRAQVTNPNLFSPLQDAIFKSSLTHMSMNWIFSVFCVNFQCLKSPNVTPRWLRFAGWSGGHVLCAISPAARRWWLQER